MPDVDPPPQSEPTEIGELQRQIYEGWQRGAAFFDERWGDDGDELHQGVFAPAAERLLGLERGHRVIEFACGNGGFARRLARNGMSVAATDLSPALLMAAGRRTPQELAREIEYHELDATDETAITSLQRELGGGPFDAAVCIMGLMSMPLLRPMFGGAFRVLRPRGAFVLVTLHPAYATAASNFAPGDEEQQRPHGLTVTRYLSRYATHGVTNVMQQERQVYFHRPLQELLSDAFGAGWSLDGVEELAAPLQEEGESKLMWNVLPEIPMALALRLRKPA